MTDRDQAPEEPTPPTNSGGDERRRGPMRAEVLHVVGRGGSDARGLSPVAELTLKHDDGRTMAFRQFVPEGARNVTARPIGVVMPLDFGFCPICGDDSNLTKEHIPQRDLGGTVMTRTCQRCNNGLGSRVEEELRHWFDGAIFSVRFGGGGVRGKRKSARMLLRTTSSGEVALIQDAGKSHTDVRKIFASGAGEMDWREPDPRIWRVAVLKHAYLAACLALGDVPDTEHAAVLRGVLVQARDTTKGGVPASSNLAKTLRIYKSGRAAQGPTVVLAGLVDSDGSVLDWGLSLAGTLFVSWPLDAHLFWQAARRFGGQDVWFVEAARRAAEREAAE